jgi:hypothetical protein
MSAPRQPHLRVLNELGMSALIESLGLVRIIHASTRLSYERLDAFASL